MLNFIGSDSGFGLNNTSAYFINDKRFVLIDCGFTVFHKVKDIIVNYDEIDILITHLHNDHAGSLAQLLSYLYFVHNKKVRIISKCERIVDYLDLTATPRESYSLVDGTDYVQVIETEHVKGMDSYGFKINIDGKNIIYTGDTTTLEPFIPYMEDVSELYTDASASSSVHLIIENVLDILEDISNKGIKIYLMHTDDKEYIRSVTNNKYTIV